MAIPLQHKILNELKERVDNYSQQSLIGGRVFNVDTGESFSFGGVWDPGTKKFIRGLIPSDKAPQIKVTDPQWEFIKNVIKALKNPDKNQQIKINDIVLSGGRRSGKSVVLAVVTFMILALRPRAKVMLLGLELAHGERILSLIQDWYGIDNWTPIPKQNRTVFKNFSSVKIASGKNFRNKRGEFYDFLILDEAAFLSEKIYNALFPLILERNGAVIMSSSPDGYNWFYDKFKKAHSKDPLEAGAVLYTELSTLQNRFLDPQVLKRTEEQLSVLMEDNPLIYKQEILGQFLPQNKLVYQEFQKEHIVNINKTEFKSLGPELIPQLYPSHPQGKYLVGLDFGNINHMVILDLVSFEGDPKPKILVLKDLQIPGLDGIAEVLKRSASELKIDVNQFVIVADISGTWQTFTGAKRARKASSFRIMNSMGFKLLSPNGTDYAPGRSDRYDIIRLIQREQPEKNRLFISAECDALIKSWIEYETDEKTALPKKDRKNEHWHDALTYALYNLYFTRNKETLKRLNLQLAIKIEDLNLEVMKESA